MLTLIVSDLQGNESTYPITKEKTTVGRKAPADIVVGGKIVSSRHALISILDDGEISVEDLGSANGSFVNGHRIEEPVLLHSKDTLQIGEFRLRVKKETSGKRPRTVQEHKSKNKIIEPSSSDSPVEVEVLDEEEIQKLRKEGVLPEDPVQSEENSESISAQPPHTDDMHEAVDSDEAPDFSDDLEGEGSPEDPSGEFGAPDASDRLKDYSYLIVFLKPIQKFLLDPDISEIMVNRFDEIWIEKSGKLFRTEAHFKSEMALEAAVKNIARSVERRIDEHNPRLDARLPDGSRVHAVLPPCARFGVCLDIRKFSRETLTVERLIDFGSLHPPSAQFLDAAVRCQRNIIVSGGTGSGKTSLLNVLSSLIPNNERILVIEDASELQLQQDHLLCFESRMPDKKGRGAVTIRDLLHSSLRLRPDRIVIGEIRGQEALDLLQAMNTGHGGSMTTIHANSPQDTLTRLETCVLMGGVDLPHRAIREQVASAIDMVVYTGRLNDGSRKVTAITEILSLDDRNQYQTRDIFRFVQEGRSEDGTILGHIQATGAKPTFLDEIVNHGIHLPEDCFDPIPPSTD
ncbi:MAG: ATPase, T2SS/T4P/T4SS family [Planctomycetota bacterium]|nr:ATPase, T2SS/T4P/T4SS family [Planctomycetota bacterium]